jgi:1,4-alpha-glucan branching enzyme
LHREPALYEQDFAPQGFEWISCHDHAQSTLAWIRRAREKTNFLVIACNFTPQPHLNHQIGVPLAGRYHEIFNSDRESYGGSGMGNPAPLASSDVAHEGFEQSIVLTLPPLAAIILQPGTTGPA